jgi:glycine/D-amino acid oxidase-like deaminating enzyme
VRQGPYTHALAEDELFDCVILGAGIVGAACAHYCAEAGMRVAVVERGQVGGGATSAAMGHAVLMSDSPALFALTLRSQQLWEALRPGLPEMAEYRQPGTLWIAADDDEMAEVERKHAYYSDLGVATAVLRPAALAAAEPNLRLLTGALQVPGDSILAPPAVAAWLLEQAVSRGAILVHGEVVAAGEGIVTLADGPQLLARRIVLATGADAATLVPALPLRKRKGHLMITAPHPGYVRHQLVELGYLKSAHGDEADSVAFNVQPRANGQLLIGSSRQYGVEHDAVDQHVLDAILTRAIEYLPGVGALLIERSWAGFRGATPDHLPLIGPADAGDPTLLLATGHEGLGITTSLATAELLVDHILGRAGAIPAEPYLPSRLAPPRPATIHSQENL